ncbi:MAG: MogA/MoaB family molybdenum cofactor biosynthesis protein [Actinobacteria bacterium]|nr:MogA/MoaB family molybdenum cofactor biosynthesis protein [Actinomycetota bacterium]MCA1722328.1 MogA/MoaB family molybdenum cofactor biosynthesis protein [Actinomycetota bacterium]
MGAVEGLPAGARAAVVTVSDRSHGGLRHDSSGPLLAQLLGELGFEVGAPVVVPDEVDAVQAALRDAVAAGYDVVVTTGGTGFAPRDVTPEATRPLLERDAAGIVEALRQHRRDEVPTTILSRAVAGTIGCTFVCNLPGSTGGVRDGVAVLAPVVGHLVAQLRGGDH